jgi:hypothetical protein
VSTNLIDELHSQPNYRKTFLVQFFPWLGAYYTEAVDSQMCHPPGKGQQDEDEHKPVRGKEIKNRAAQDFVGDHYELCK